MIRAFNMICHNAKHFAEWEAAGKSYFDKNWRQSKGGLEAFVRGGDLSGEQVRRAWFDAADTHVFVSHSHKDESLAVGLAGYLQSLGLIPFIDSMIWGDSRKLLRRIDEQHCRSESDANCFDYDKRNYSTSHVHMMLASALTEMIDRTDAVIFLNTPNSIDIESAAAPGDAVTASPWIYHELATTRIVRKIGYEGRLPPSVSLEEDRQVIASLRIVHKVPMEHLAALTPEDLARIAATQKRGLKLLDELYLRHDRKR